ncbi:ribonuclease H-like domain-containing protein [Tanacetum coccineum]
MSSNSDDIQAAGFDTRPPMLDRTDYESWSQRIRLYCRGKENGLLILQSIDQGPFELGTTRNTHGTTPEGGVLLGPERPRTYEDLSDTKKKRYDADVRATNIVLQGLPKDIYKLINHNIEAKTIWDNVKMLLAGFELTKEDRESQLYDEFERFKMLPGENINEYYDRFVIAVKLNKGLKETNHEQLYAYLKQHEKHDAQDRLIIERITPAPNDQLAFVSIVIQNENSKKRISTEKDGVVRILSPVSAAEIHAVEKERKARTILLMAIPKEHLRRFHGMDDAKEIWEAIRTRFGGNANSKKMQKAVLKQQFEAFSISSSEGLEKGYDRFQQLLSQLEAHGAEVSTEDANHKFLTSLLPAWSNLAMTMRTKPNVDTLSIDDLYNNLRQDSTNKFKTGITGAYILNSYYIKQYQEKSTCFVFADEVIIYSLPNNRKIFGLAFQDDLEQIDDVDIEEMDINWQIAMIAIRMKKFYKKTGRRVRIDGNKPVGFDKKKLECFKCHNTGHFARECPSKGTNDGKKRDSIYQDQGAEKKEQNQNCEQEAKILAYTLAVKKLEAQIVTFQKQQLSLNEQLTFQANEIYAKDEKLKRYRRIGMKAVKEKEQLKKIVDSWKDSSKNLWKLIDSGMSSTSKVGLGYEIKSNNEVLSYEEEMNRSVFKCTEEDYINKPLYSRFTKTNSFKGVPHPLTGDYTPKPQEEIDDSLYVYGKKGPQKPEISDSDDNSTEHSTCQSNDSEGSYGNTSEHSSESESESISVTNEMSTSKSVITNEKVVSESKEVKP